MVNEYEPWKEHGETEVEYLRRTYLKESKTYYEDGFDDGLERAAEMVETWANGNTPITVDEIAAAIRKEVK